MTTYDAARTTGSPVRTLSAWAVIALAPPAAWLAWIATSGGYPSDARHVLWFATVAAGAVVAGALAPRGGRTLAGLSVLGVVSTVGTLFAWWSSEDETGLFMVGLLLATPLVIGAAPALLALGRLLPLGRRRR